MQIKSKGNRIMWFHSSRIIPSVVALALMAAAWGTLAGAVSAAAPVPGDEPVDSQPWNHVDPDYKHASPEAVERWHDMKYGLRICWGSASSMLNQDVSWELARRNDPAFSEKYHQLYKSFNPVDFNADEWTGMMVRTGLKYFTFTAKHHDGFSMFDTKARIKKRFIYTGPRAGQIEDCDLAYSIMETTFKRDIVKELVEAGRRRGLGVGLYFSHWDWYDADFRWGGADGAAGPNGLKDDTSFSKETDPEGYARFVARHRQQVLELCGNYGPIINLCFDCPVAQSKTQSPFWRQAWPDTKQTLKMARELQPGVMMRQRGLEAYGDYSTPEGEVPDHAGQEISWGGGDPAVKRPWQSIIKMAGWVSSYNPNAADYHNKGPWIVSTLVDVVSKGGNFQVATGPDSEGKFHPKAIEALEYAGAWLKVNGEAIYATRPRDGDQWKEGGDVRFTRSKDGKTIYAICLKWPDKTLALGSVRPEKDSAITMLGVLQPLAWRFDERKGLTIELPEALQDPKNRPCECAWAIKIRGETFVAPSADAAAAVAPAVPSDNFVENGDFSKGEAGQLPAGWTIFAPNPVLAPSYKLVKGDDGTNLLLVEGNGRKECFGILRHHVTLPPGKTYRFRVRFKFQGFDDVNRHLVHGVFTKKNDGIFTYRKEGEWAVGETRLALAGEGDVRLYFRFAPKGKVWYSNVSLTECEPVQPRLVKLAVTQGGGDRNRWEKFLDTAGQKHCAVALMSEFFNGNHDPQKPEPMDGPSMKFMSEKAKQWKMYVCGTFLLKRGDLVYNSAPLWDRQGKLVGIYDKTMLYEEELEGGTSPGYSMPVFKTDFGRVGIMTCYDSWHPSTVRLLALKGAELILFPSAGYYMQLMHARAADNGVVVAATSTDAPCGVWDGGGNQADGGSPDSTRFPYQIASTSIVAFEKDDSQKMQIVTVDLSKKPSPHYWGGPMASAPGGRRARATSPWYLEDEISREVHRWFDDPVGVHGVTGNHHGEAEKKGE